MVLRLTLSLCFTGVASSVNKESNSSEESSIITHCLTWRRGECVSCLSAACQNSPLCVCVCERACKCSFRFLFVCGYSVCRCAVKCSILCVRLPLVTSYLNIKGCSHLTLSCLPASALCRPDISSLCVCVRMCVSILLFVFS